MNADGSNQAVIYTSNSPVASPSWSPNGDRIAFQKGGINELLNLLTGSTTSTKATGTEPDWKRF